MKETNKIKVTRLLIPVLLLAMLVVSSCKPKATHLTQNLENSGVPGLSFTPTPGESTQAIGQQTASAQPPTSVNDPTATSFEPVITQATSITLSPIQTPTSAAIVLTPTATTKSGTPQAATSTLAPTQTRTPTPTLTKQPTGSATMAPTQTRTSTPTLTKQPTGSATLAPTQTRTSSPTLTVTATPTGTATLTPSPTSQTGWAGEWTAYLAQPDGTYRSGKLIVSVSGDSVISVFDNAGITMNLEGSLQTDGVFVSGDYTSPSDSGSFKWVIQENSYIIGNINNEWAFCAAREGSPQPDPCGYFDPR